MIMIVRWLFKNSALYNATESYTWLYRAIGSMSNGTEPNFLVDNIIVVIPVIAIIGVSLSSILHSFSPEVTTALWKNKDTVLGLFCMTLGLITSMEMYYRITDLKIGNSGFTDVMLDPLTAPAFHFIFSLLVFCFHFWGMTSSLMASVQTVLLFTGGILSVLLFLWAGLCTGRVFSGMLYILSVLLGAVVVQGTGMMLDMSIFKDLGEFSAVIAGTLFKPLRILFVGVWRIIMEFIVLICNEMIPAIGRVVIALYQKILLRLVLKPCYNLFNSIWVRILCPAVSRTYNCILLPAWHVLKSALSAVMWATTHLSEFLYRSILIPLFENFLHFASSLKARAVSFYTKGILPLANKGLSLINVLMMGILNIMAWISFPFLVAYDKIISLIVSPVANFLFTCIIRPSVFHFLSALEILWGSMEFVAASALRTIVYVGKQALSLALHLSELLYDTIIIILESLFLLSVEIWKTVRVMRERGGNRLRRIMLAVYNAFHDPLVQLHQLLKQITFPLILLASATLFFRNALSSIILKGELPFGLILGCYVNLIVGCMLISVHIPDARIATTLLQITLSLYNGLDFGLLYFLVRSIEVVVDLLRVALDSLNRLISTLWKSVFELLNVVIERLVKEIWSLAATLYETLLRPLGTALHSGVLLIWSNPFVSLTASLAVLFISYKMHQMAVLSHIRVMLYGSLVCVVRNLYNFITALSLPIIGILQVPLVQRFIIILRDGFNSLSGEMSIWINSTLDKSLFTLCSNGTFGWALYACHAFSSVIARENRVDPKFIARGWMKAFYFPLFFISIFSSKPLTSMSNSLLIWLGLSGIIVLSAAVIHFLFAIFVLIMLLVMISEFIARIGAPRTTRRHTSQHVSSHVSNRGTAVRNRRVPLRRQAVSVDLGPYLRGLEPIHKFEASECSICCDSYSAAATEMNNTNQSSITSALYLPCGHKFHEECVVNWLQAPNSRGLCPICRERVPLPNDHITTTNLRSVFL